MDHNELKIKLEMVIPYVTKASDNVIDITVVKRVAKQMITQIINHREIYGKEPNLNQKKEYFYEARFAETERSKLALELSKIAPNKTTGERIVFEQKPLVKEYIALGTNRIKADFMANEVIKYEDKFGLYMPLKTR